MKKITIALPSLSLMLYLNNRTNGNPRRKDTVYWLFFINSLESTPILELKIKSIISIFAGRMSDVGKDPVPIFKKCVKLSKKYNKIQILWASTREPYNFIQANQIDCDIITMPAGIIEKVSKFGKSFQSLTVDTVKKFLIDSEESNFKL